MLYGSQAWLFGSLFLKPSSQPTNQPPRVSVYVLAWLLASFFVCLIDVLHFVLEQALALSLPVPGSMEASVCEA